MFGLNVFNPFLFFLNLPQFETKNTTIFAPLLAPSQSSQTLQMEAQRHYRGCRIVARELFDFVNQKDNSPSWDVLNQLLRFIARNEMAVVHPTHFLSLFRAQNRVWFGNRWFNRPVNATLFKAGTLEFFPVQNSATSTFSCFVIQTPKFSCGTRSTVAFFTVGYIASSNVGDCDAMFGELRHVLALAMPNHPISRFLNELCPPDIVRITPEKHVWSLSTSENSALYIALMLQRIFIAGRVAPLNSSFDHATVNQLRNDFELDVVASNAFPDSGEYNTFLSDNFRAYSLHHGPIHVGAVDLLKGEL